MKRGLIAALLVFWISACTAVYDRPTSSYSQYIKDGATCIKEASGAVSAVAKASWDEFWLYYYGKKLFCRNMIIRVLA